MPAGYAAFSGRTSVADRDPACNAQIFEDRTGVSVPRDGGPAPVQKQPFYFQFQAWPVSLKIAAASALGVGALTFSALFGLPVYGFTVLLLYPAVLASAYLWGRAAGFACTLVTAVSIAILLHVDKSLPSSTATTSIVAVLLFTVAGLSASMMLSTLNRALRELGRSHVEAVVLQLEKDLLLRELRHRVKNDLANVCAVLQIEARNLNGEAAETVRYAVQRVQVIAQLHERMEPDRHGSVVEAGSYIEELCEDYRATFLQGQDIRLDVTCDRLFLDANRAVVLGLIANELVTNALKHAFPDSRAGTISVMLRGTVSDGELTICDDGVGMPDKQGSGSGRRLISALARQMDASLSRQPSSSGTCWRLRFGFN